MTSEEEAFFNGFHQGMAKGRDDEREACAMFLEIRADVIEREGFSFTSKKLAQTYREDANAFRNGKSPVTGASSDD